MRDVEWIAYCKVSTLRTVMRLIGGSWPKWWRSVRVIVTDAE